MSELRVSKVAVAEDDCNLSLSFVVAGDPPVQQRPRMNCKWNKKVPTYYDPSSLKKKTWKKDLEKALVNYGNISFPFFKEKHTDNMKSDGLHLDVVFFIGRRRSDYRSKMGTLYLKDDVQKYPGTKDTDNMLKLVMDACHDVLYDDDKCVVSFSASKKFVPEEERERGGYTTIRFITL
jgi:Holliday junction resolvase RusA-like endonuclease